MKKQLPLHPNLEQLKKQARQMLRGQRGGDPHVLRQIQEHHPRWRNSTEEALRAAKLTLGDAQLAVASQYGFASWAVLKAHVESRAAAAGSDADIRTFLQAACRGDVAALTAFLDAQPELIHEQGGPGVRTALHEAVDSGSEDAVRLLLERGADPNLRCEGDNATPLHFAAG